MTRYLLSLKLELELVNLLLHHFDKLVCCEKFVVHYTSLLLIGLQQVLQLKNTNHANYFLKFVKKQNLITL